MLCGWLFGWWVATMREVRGGRVLTKRFVCDLFYTGWFENNTFYASNMCCLEFICSFFFKFFLLLVFLPINGSNLPVIALVSTVYLLSNWEVSSTFQQIRRIICRNIINKLNVRVGLPMGQFKLWWNNISAKRPNSQPIPSTAATRNFFSPGIFLKWIEWMSEWIEEDFAFLGHRKAPLCLSQWYWWECVDYYIMMELRA